MSLVPRGNSSGKDRLPCSVRTRRSWSEPASDARVSLSETTALYVICSQREPGALGLHKMRYNIATSLSVTSRSTVRHFKSFKCGVIWSKRRKFFTFLTLWHCNFNAGIINCSVLWRELAYHAHHNENSSHFQPCMRRVLHIKNLETYLHGKNLTPETILLRWQKGLLPNKLFFFPDTASWKNFEFRGI